MSNFCYNKMFVYSFDLNKIFSCTMDYKALASYRFNYVCFACVDKQFGTSYNLTTACSVGGAGKASVFSISIGEKNAKISLWF